MPNDPCELKHVQLEREPGDGLMARVMEMQVDDPGFARGGGAARIRVDAAAGVLLD